MKKNIMTGVYTRNNQDYNFNFYTSLSTYDKMIFVNSVVDAIVDDIRYDSIIRNLMFDFNIIAMFTDIDISFADAIDDDGNKINPIISIEQFLEETNIVDIVKANINTVLIDELNDAINKSIEYRTGIHPSLINDAIASLISTLEKKIEEVDLDSMMGMVQKFANMTEDFTVENAVNAYMNSDIHKNNLIDIENYKSKNK